jgi:hypothetical protein
MSSELLIIERLIEVCSKNILNQHILPLVVRRNIFKLNREQIIEYLTQLNNGKLSHIEEKFLLNNVRIFFGTVDIELCNWIVENIKIDDMKEFEESECFMNNEEDEYLEENGQNKNIFISKSELIKIWKEKSM